MGGKKDPDKVELVFPSLLDYLSLVNAVTEEIATQLGVDEETQDAISNSVIEACTNAIEHGNKMDRTKNVRLRFRSGPEKIEIDVTDEGDGFDPGAVPDPRSPENLMRERGRGIFILKNFMDEVRYEFSEGTTTLFLVKNLTVPAGKNGN